MIKLQVTGHGEILAIKTLTAVTDLPKALAYMTPP